jgi:hypothetical protein
MERMSRTFTLSTLDPPTPYPTSSRSSTQLSITRTIELIRGAFLDTLSRLLLSQYATFSSRDEAFSNKHCLPPQRRTLSGSFQLFFHKFRCERYCFIGTSSDVCLSIVFITFRLSFQVDPAIQLIAFSAF